MALALFVTGALLAPAALREADASPCGSIAEPYRPVCCDCMTHLSIDFLNDEVDTLPEAWAVRAGEVVRGEKAAFKIYGVSDDPRFYEDLTPQIKSLRFRMHGLPSTRVRYEENDGDPRWVYQPLHRPIAGKTGTVEVSFRCKSPAVVYKTNFFLTVLPRH